MDGKTGMGVSATEGYKELQRGLAQGRRDFPSSHQKVFFDYLKAVAAYEEFGAKRGEMVKALEDAEADGLFSSVQTRLPWVTDVFLHGILAGAEARTVVLRELLERCAEIADVSPMAKRALQLDRSMLTVYNAGARKTDERTVRVTVRNVLDEVIGGIARLEAEERDCESTGRRMAFGDKLSLVRWCLKYLPVGEREGRLGDVLAAIDKVKSDTGASSQDVAATEVFREKYGMIPIAAGMEEAYSALRCVSIDAGRAHEGFVWNKALYDEVGFAVQAELESALKSCMWRCTCRDAAELRRVCDVVLAMNDVRQVLRLKAVSDDARERIANGIVGMELLWALAYSASRRLDSRGSGKIPPMHIGSRIGPDGREVNVDETLDSMVAEAICRMLAVRSVNGVDIVTHAVFREYREGEFDDKYLTAIVDNAIANRRYAHVCPKAGPKIVMVSGDEPMGQDEEGNDGGALFDTVIAVAKESPRDYAWFALNVVKKYAPKLWNYMRLVELGVSASDLKQMCKSGFGALAEKYAPFDKVSKGDALKIVGATTTHLVEREREALLKALESQSGADYEILIERVKSVLKKS